MIWALAEGTASRLAGSATGSQPLRGHGVGAAEGGGEDSVFARLDYAFSVAQNAAWGALSYSDPYERIRNLVPLEGGAVVCS